MAEHLPAIAAVTAPTRDELVAMATQQIDAMLDLVHADRVQVVSVSFEGPAGQNLRQRYHVADWQAEQNPRPDCWACRSERGETTARCAYCEGGACLLCVGLGEPHRWPCEHDTVDRHGGLDSPDCCTWLHTCGKEPAHA